MSAKSCKLEPNSARQSRVSGRHKTPILVQALLHPQTRGCEAYRRCAGQGPKLFLSQKAVHTKSVQVLSLREERGVGFKGQKYCSGVCGCMKRGEGTVGLFVGHGSCVFEIVCLSPCVRQCGPPPLCCRFTCVVLTSGVGFRLVVGFSELN